MKKIFYFLLFLTTTTYGQVLDGTLRNRAIVIRDETIAGRNTPYRIGSMFLNLVESKTNLIQGVTALGTNDYSVTISSAVTVYIDGLELTIKVGNTNTAASTLNVNALGAKTIVDVASGDLEAGKYYKLVYNGTAFQVVGGLGGSDISDITGLQDSLSAKQPLDSDLTSISGLSPTNDDVVQRKAGVWTNRSIAQLKVDEAINNVDNTSDANKPVSTATQTALDGKQTLDSDLTSIAGLTPTNDDIIQRKAGVWTNRTISQVKTDLAISNVDNTSDANKPVSTAQQTALDLKANLASPTFTGTVVVPSQSNGDNSTKAANTAYADAKVVQTITNGVTSSAPSQDAVFDANALKADLASPAFTGNPTAPTQSVGNNSTRLATTAYVDVADALKANIASPTFTGTPAAPTASPGTNTTQLATTAFVAAAVTVGAVSDGDKGDLTVSSSGTVWTVDAGAITNSKIQTAPTFTTSATAPIVYGSSAANGDVQIEGTSSATKTTSYISMQPTGGQVAIGTTTPTSTHAVLNVEITNLDGGSTRTPTAVISNTSPTLGSGSNYNISVLSMNAGNLSTTAQLAANYGSSATAPFTVRGGILATRTSGDGWLFYNNSVLSGIIGETGYSTPYKEATGFGSQLTLGTGSTPSSCCGGYPTIFGYQAQGPGVAFGYKAQATNFEAVAIGPQARANCLACTAIGDGARALASGPNGNEWVSGDVTWATGNIDYILGGGMGTARDFILAIGQGSTTTYDLEVATANHQGFLGYYQENSSYFSGGAGLWNDWYIGGPVTASAPHAITWNVTSGQGTNIAGVDYTFNASRATGNAASGSWIFKTADVGASGSTLQTLTTKLSITPAGVLIKGTATNDAASAGNVGEEINSAVSTYTNFTTTATYQAITSITLTAGDWDISAFATYSSNSSTITAASNAIFVISTTTASASGATEGVNIMYVPQAALLGTSKFTDTITPYRVSISGSTTYYLNAQATFTVGNPQFVGSIRARRMR